VHYCLLNACAFHRQSGGDRAADINNEVSKMKVEITQNKQQSDWK
jgi:hypothetical protein